MSAVPNSFKYRQNAPFSVLVFKKILCRSTSFQTSSQCTIYHLCFHFFLQFQFVSNIRMHVLEILFSKDSCSFQSFQILSECMLQRHCLKKKMSAVPNSFKQCQNAFVIYRKTVFIFSLQFRTVSNIVRIHALEILSLIALHHVLLI